jgi:hypothetical protein
MMTGVTQNTITITAITQGKDSLSENDTTLLKIRGIPIGWSRSTAPLSWFKKPDFQIVYDLDRPLDQYNKKRNEGGIGMYLSWFFGILMTAVMTCFGAPFWFDILSKFVNIRRSGGRPVDQPQS